MVRLRRLAEKERRSLNQQAIWLLERALDEKRPNFTEAMRHSSRTTVHLRSTMRRSMMCSRDCAASSWDVLRRSRRIRQMDDPPLTRW